MHKHGYGVSMVSIERIVLICIFMHYNAWNIHVYDDHIMLIEIPFSWKQYECVWKDYLHVYDDSKGEM